MQTAREQNSAYYVRGGPQNINLNAAGGKREIFDGLSCKDFDADPPLPDPQSSA